MPTEEDLRARFWEKVEVRESDECWVWRGSSRGYFRFGTRGVVHVRRVAWEITYGAPPPRIQITTTCKTKLCCNPDHLTYRAGDRESPHAEAFGRTRFTKRDKKRIQKQHSDGMSLYELRSRWNANTATLLHILKNQT